MFTGICTNCARIQEEYLKANEYNGGQVVCWCYTEEEIIRYYERERNLVEMSDDEELETAMMFLGEENTNNEDPVEVTIEGTPGDGFEKEILADYKSQDYEFISDMTTHEVASPNDDMDWLFIDEGEASM